jgi:hypothetical protein
MGADNHFPMRNLTTSLQITFYRGCDEDIVDIKGEAEGRRKTVLIIRTLSTGLVQLKSLS